MNKEIKSEKNNKKTKREPKIGFVGMIIVLALFGYVSSQNKTKRSRLDEIKRLPYHNVALDAVEDGSYYGETSTSFLFVGATVEVQDHKIQNIKIEKMNGKGSEHLEEIANRMVQDNTSRVQMKNRQELETCVLMSCVDSALYGLEVKVDAEN